MSNTMLYKNYAGSVEFSEEDGLFYGKVLGIRSLISFEGTTAKELVEDFHGAVDDYIETCRAEGIEPETALRGASMSELRQRFIEKQLFMLSIIMNL